MRYRAPFSVRLGRGATRRTVDRIPAAGQLCRPGAEIRPCAPGADRPPELLELTRLNAWSAPAVLTVYIPEPLYALAHPYLSADAGRYSGSPRIPARRIVGPAGRSSSPTGPGASPALRTGPLPSCFMTRPDSVPPAAGPEGRGRGHGPRRLPARSGCLRSYGPTSGRYRLPWMVLRRTIPTVPLCGPLRIALCNGRQLVRHRHDPLPGHP